MKHLQGQKFYIQNEDKKPNFLDTGPSSLVLISQHVV